MRARAWLPVLLLAFVAPASAEEPSVPKPPPFVLPGAIEESRAEALRYVAMRGNVWLLTQLDVVRTEMLRRLTTRNSVEVKRSVDYIDHYLMPALRGRIPEFMRMYAEIIAAKFTASEIRMLEAFLSTPVGSKYLAQEDDIGREMATAYFTWRHAVENDAATQFRRDKAAQSDRPIEQ